MADREKYIFIAKLAEQAEKYDEIVRSMKLVAEMKKELSVEERNLLSVGYKNLIGSRRASWRTITSIEMAELEKGNNSLKMEAIKEYKEEIETEMTDLCKDVLQLIDTYLLPMSTTLENKVFFFKMKGDYCRYLSEFIPSNSDICDKSLTAYKAACDLAMTENGLGLTHPIRLGLILNFSVFFYEILGEPTKALVLAKEAYDKAVRVIDVVPKDHQKDAIIVMELLRDNISVWTAETAGDSPDEKGDTSVSMVT